MPKKKRKAKTKKNLQKRGEEISEKNFQKKEKF